MVEQAGWACGLALALLVVVEVPGVCSGLGVAVAQALVVWVAERPLVAVVAAELGEQAGGAGGVALALLAVFEVPGVWSGLGVAVALALVVWVAVRPLVAVVAAELGFDLVVVVWVFLW